MKLVLFQIKNYRSVTDSGPVHIAQFTALVGRNESGKTNILRALNSLNPADGFKKLSGAKDFPRDRRTEECTENTPVVISLWKLEDDEKAKLCEIWSGGTSVNEVEITRYYGDVRTVKFVGESEINADINSINSKIKKIASAVETRVAKSENSLQVDVKPITNKFIMNASVFKEPGFGSVWAVKAKSEIDELRQTMSQTGIVLTELQGSTLDEVEAIADEVITEKENRENAIRYILEGMPTFIYVEEYPELMGHQSISEYLGRKGTEHETDADVNFGKMCRLADLSPEKLQENLNQDGNETRNQHANRASAVITKEIQNLWHDRKLKIRFDVDADHINTLVSDKNTDYEVEVNLDNRSRGFQWFFSFYVIFATDTKYGLAKDAILLLDEPGLYLHAKSQQDLLQHLERNFTNQIIFSTHSPFMVPAHRIDDICTASITEESGTIVSNDLSGDQKTLFPLQAALGYNLVQSLFFGPRNVVVEGITDFWVLSSISEYLNSIKDRGLNNVTITPAGGAGKIPYMVCLLLSEKLEVLALLDDEGDSKQIREKLIQSDLLCDKNVIFLSEAYESTIPSESAIEDLLNPQIYETLVNECYQKELEGIELTLNNHIPRIAKRYEQAFAEQQLKFEKSRPLRLFIKKMGEQPSQLLDDQTKKRFIRLFSKINERMDLNFAT